MSKRVFFVKFFQLFCMIVFILKWQKEAKQSIFHGFIHIWLHQIKNEGSFKHKHRDSGCLSGWAFENGLKEKATMALCGMF